MKKIVTTIMLTILLGSVLAGCGNSGDELDPRDLVYRHERLACMEDIRGDVTHFTVFEDTVYICSREWADMNVEEGTDRHFFYTCNPDGTGLAEIEEEGLYREGEWLFDMEVSAEGNLLLLFSGYNENLAQDTYMLRTVAKDGALISEEDVSQWLDMGDEYIQNVKVDKDNNLYLLTENNIYVVDRDGNLSGQIALEKSAENLIRTGNGEMFAGFASESGYIIKKINPEETVFSGEYHTTLSYYSSYIIDGDEAFDFYYSTGETLYGYLLEDSSSKEVVDWISGNVNTNFVGKIQMLSGNRMLAIYGEAAWEEPHGIYLFEKMDPKDVKIKETITFVTLYPDEGAKAEAYRFNKSQDKYQVVVKDYSFSEDPHLDLYKDLIAGRCGDIVDLSGTASEKYVNMGLFEDLYEWMEDDPDVKKDDFAEHLLKVMETDGKLYHVSPTVGINVLVAGASDTDTKNSLTFAQIGQMEEGGAKAFYQESKMSLLSNLVEMNYGEYVDWQNGQCHFDGEMFLKVLEYANSYPAEVVWDETTEDMTTKIRRGDILFAQVYSASVADVQLYEEMFQEDIVLTGAPSERYAGPAMSMNRDLAICSASGNKKGAWEFLKRFLVREYASGQIVDDMLPVPIRKDSMEDMIKRYTAAEPYTDDFGNEITPLSYEWGYEELTLQVSPLTDKQMTVFTDAVERIDHKYVYDSDIMTIISEETADYFSGKISAEQTADNIQKRVSVYMEDYR